MVYNYVNGKIIIGKLYDEFNIQSSDWELRTPNWINDALKDIGARKAMKVRVNSIKFNDYSFKLPCSTRVLQGIIINNRKLDRVNELAFKLTNKNINNKSNYVYLLNGDEVELEFKEGTAHVVYMDLPVEWDDDLGMWIPLIPNVPRVIEAVTYYVLKIILARGYIHPLYSLTTNNPELNPALLWRDTRKKARISANRMDNEDRRNMSDVLTNFLNNPRADSKELFSRYISQIPTSNEPIHTFADIINNS